MANYTDRMKLRIDATGNMQQEINKAESAFSGLGKAVIAVGVAFGAFKTIQNIIGPAISKAADFEATMQSLRAVTNVTGRDMNEVLAAMDSQIGGLASRASIASGFLKGMTTELNVDQMNNMTTAIRDASIAMGEDFNEQFPLIIKAIKQLNPAILDNIGVTVRLDEVNKKIKDGFFGAGTAINEFTQQNAIYQEVMRQTAKFQGQEAELLETTKGKWLAFKTALDDASVSLGNLIIEGEGANTVLDQLTRTVTDATTAFEALSNARGWLETLLLLIPSTHAYVNAMILAREAAEALDLSLIPSHLTEAEQALRDHNAAIERLFQEGVEFSRQTNQLILEDKESLTDDLMADEEEFVDWQVANLQRGLDEQIEAQRKALIERTKIQRFFGERMEAAAVSSVQSHVNAWIDGRARFQDIFKNIAKDFLKLFIQKVLADLAGILVVKALKLLALFDKADNDRMVVEEGRRYAMFFTQGVLSGLNDANLGQRITPNSFGLTSSSQQPIGNSIVVNFNGPITDREYVRREIVPVIEEAAAGNLSRISLNNETLTGGSFA